MVGGKTVTKPYPKEMDEWPQYLHGADNNAVAKDTVVGPPNHLRWTAKPFWAREHRYGNKFAMVSEGGRIFYIDNDVRESIALLPDRPSLVARDAFNGTILWKKDVPDWHNNLWPLKSGPTQLARRLVAVERRRDGVEIPAPLDNAQIFGPTLDLQLAIRILQRYFIPMRKRPAHLWL